MRYLFFHWPPMPLLAYGMPMHMSKLSIILSKYLGKEIWNLVPEVKLIIHGKIKEIRDRDALAVHGHSLRVISRTDCTNLNLETESI